MRRKGRLKELESEVKEITVLDGLGALFSDSDHLDVTNQDRVVIFSDLHMGNGGSRDDFLRNSELFQRVLSDHYLANGFRLILNGDIEERQKHTGAAIHSAWPAVFELFDRFNSGPGLCQLVGNHDADLANQGVPAAVRLRYGLDTLFVFHGHQATIMYEILNRLIGLMLRHVARPLHIKNPSVAHDSARRYKIERLVYEFAIRNRIVSIIGHTHRPLFESMSKSDSLRYEIETLVRRYVEADRDEQLDLKRSIDGLRIELQELQSKGEGLAASVYASGLHVPCMFNSGCVVGKRGITAIEIVDGDIRLVHWFDPQRGRKYLHHDGHESYRLDGTDLRRVILKQDSLKYVFSRIKLLAGVPEMSESTTG